MSKYQTKFLGESDIARIVKLEERSFIPPLQATAEILVERFALGHQMIGVERVGELVGLLSYAFGNFDPNDFAGFPKTRRQICMLPPINPANAAFTYNLVFHPQHRGRFLYMALSRAASADIKQRRCKWVVGNLRAPSYAGSDPANDQESINARPNFRQVIDRCLAGGSFPTQEEFRLDPLLAFYQRVTGCHFLWLLPNLAPEDTATGGHRVIAYQDVDTWYQRFHRKGDDAPRQATMAR